MTKPIQQPIKHIYSTQIHKNGKDRKRKIMAHTDQGMVSARRAYYSMYHPDWDFNGKIIHLNQDDLDFTESNLVLLTTRECNNLVHFNNNLTPKNNPQLQSRAIDLVKARIAVHDLDKEGGVYHERSTKS
jgi:hypothetical protein